MKRPTIFLTAMVGCFASIVSHAFAQNSTQSIQLFGPVNVRMSPSTASSRNPDIFNSNTLNLTCPASPSAVLSSTTNSIGNVLVDNNIDVTVTVGQSPVGPINVCKGGVQKSCFTKTYQTPASAGKLNGVDPDTLLPGGGAPPIDISNMLTSGQQQVKVDLVDTGVWLTSSTLYLNTNCTSGGVSAPATITGNPIPSTNPTTQQLNQSFTFNPVANNGINFQYDLSTAQTAGTLSINNGVIPSVGDSSLDPTTWQSVWATGTSFATSNCLVHDGETLANGQAGCKLFTLTCTVGTGSNASGVNCPASTVANEAINDNFDGPTFALNDIMTTVNGSQVKFHVGMGFLMASEPWTGGSCQFAQGSGFEEATCPQNVLSTFTGPGLYNSNGITTHPNSTFITIEGVPEDLTSVQVQGMQPGNWVNTSTPTVTFSSQPPPPGLPGSSLPGAGNFVPSPIESITYGISAANSIPTPGAPVSGDQTLTNANGCPTPSSPITATPFTPSPVMLASLEDGQYALHYFAQDCAGTQEFLYQNNAGSWSTSFYTFLINVDTVAPAVSTPALSPAGPYTPGQTGVTATFSCTDSLSGVVLCGGQSFPAGTLNTGSVTVPVTISMTPGTHTFSVGATDAAGNTSSSASVPYTVVPAIDGQIHLTVTPGTVYYAVGPLVQVQVVNINGHVPTGTVQIVDNKTTTIATLSLYNGCASFYAKNLSAGTHTLTAVYSGDSFNPSGTSAPVTLTVLPAAVTVKLTASTYGGTLTLTASVLSPTASAPNATGQVTFTNGGTVLGTVPVNSKGMASVSVPASSIPSGSQKFTATYSGGTNYGTGTTTITFPDED